MAATNAVQAFREQCKDPMQHQASLLFDMLRAHQGVDVLHGTKAPDSIAQAQEVLAQLPLTTYDDYEPGIQVRG